MQNNVYDFGGHPKLLAFVALEIIAFLPTLPTGTPS
jgi:hypothetical protein